MVEPVVTPDKPVNPDPKLPARLICDQFNKCFLVVVDKLECLPLHNIYSMVLKVRLGAYLKVLN